MEIVVPKNVRDYLSSLNQLMERFPTIVPAPEAAKFMGISEKRLHDALMYGTAFGFGWKVNQRNEFYISSARFYMDSIAPFSKAGAVLVWEDSHEKNHS